MVAEVSQGSTWSQTRTSLTQVKEALVLLRTQTQAQLSTPLRLLAAEVSALQEANQKLAASMQRWSGSFQSLLKDVVRHSDALALLLGEEVPEFLERPPGEHEAFSIPALREQLVLLQEQLGGHKLSISSLLAQRSGLLSTFSTLLFP